MFDKVTVKKTKNTNGPKFTDPRTAAVSTYFKRSMTVMGDPKKQAILMKSLQTFT